MHQLVNNVGQDSLLRMVDSIVLLITVQFQTVFIVMQLEPALSVNQLIQSLMEAVLWLHVPFKIVLNARKIQNSVISVSLDLH